MLTLHVQLRNSTLRGEIKRLRFPLEIMLVCVRWYAAYPLSTRNLEEMMAERGVLVDHATAHRWALKMLPVLAKVFRHRQVPVGRSWRMDETYVRVGGQWKYLYRAVDGLGQTVDFLLTAKRDFAATKVEPGAGPRPTPPITRRGCVRPPSRRKDSRRPPRIFPLPDAT